MWHAIDHDAFAMIDTRNAASATKNNCCVACAVVDHYLDCGTPLRGFIRIRFISPAIFVRVRHCDSAIVVKLYSLNLSHKRSESISSLSIVSRLPKDRMPIS